MALIQSPLKFSTTYPLYQIMTQYLQTDFNNIISNFSQIYGDNLSTLTNFNLIYNEIKWTQYNIFIYNFLIQLPDDISVNKTIYLFNKVIVIKKLELLDTISKIIIRYVEESSNNLVNIRFALSKTFSYILSSNIFARLKNDRISMEILMNIICTQKNKTLNLFFQEVINNSESIINYTFVKDLFLQNLDKYIDISLIYINERINSNFWYDLQYIDYISYT